MAQHVAHLFIRWGVFIGSKTKITFITFWFLMITCGVQKKMIVNISNNQKNNLFNLLSYEGTQWVCSVTRSMRMVTMKKVIWTILRTFSQPTGRQWGSNLPLQVQTAYWQTVRFKPPTYQQIKSHKKDGIHIEYNQTAS